mmetsp:Transcript_23351/g.54080  ORF Transcript_23351/g.54080 Transcript_23351/m.54080 type:complete len:228 (-) Transcript_23351:50-733(-)
MTRWTAQTLPGWQGSLRCPSWRRTSRPPRAGPPFLWTPSKERHFKWVSLRWAPRSIPYGRHPPSPASSRSGGRCSRCWPLSCAFVEGSPSTASPKRTRGRTRSVSVWPAGASRRTPRWLWPSRMLNLRTTRALARRLATGTATHPIAGKGCQILLPLIRGQQATSRPTSPAPPRTEDRRRAPRPDSRATKDSRHSSTSQDQTTAPELAENPFFGLAAVSRMSQRRYW